MRENRTCGSEGGEAQSLPYPYPVAPFALFLLSTINYQLFIIHYSLFPLLIIHPLSPFLPAEYNSALVRPRWRVVSTVEVRAGVLP